MTTLEERLLSGFWGYRNRCGKAMLRAESFCARFTGHAGHCLTETAMRRAVPGASARTAKQRAARKAVR